MDGFSFFSYFPVSFSQELLVSPNGYGSQLPQLPQLINVIMYHPYN